MRLVICTEHRFDRTPDGVVWTDALYPYAFWRRYLDVFDAVRVAARVRDVPQPPAGWQPASGENVAFAATPYYLGPWQYLRKKGAIRRAIRAAVEPRDAIILRIPGTLGGHLFAVARAQNRPYGVELVGDPYDVFAPGGVRNPLRPLLRWWVPRQTRRQCAGACAVASVTEQALQKRYPAAPGAFTTHYSSIELRPEAFVATPRAWPADAPAAPRRFTLAHVGYLAHLYKAPDVLIDAVGRCAKQGWDLRLLLAGDGKHRAELERRTADLGLKDKIEFLGQLAGGDAVRAQLDRADLFVLASRQEGLPRAMIEALARALPCVGSTVGGIPELLPPEDLVPPGDADALARKIIEVLSDPQRMTRASARNLEKAREYRAEALEERRRQFYRYVRAQTEAWLQRRESNAGQA